MRKYVLILLGMTCFAFAEDKFEQMMYPTYFPEPAYNFNNNELTNEKIELGRMLFYDPALSKDNSISCASCHSPYNAFAHTDHDLSHGINDQIGTRNAPALFNLAWNKTFMWDGAINNLDMQALAPISHETEMGSSILEVVEKLRETKHYPPLFYRTFKDSTITGEKVLKVLSQFQLTLVSSNSKYDKVQLGIDTFTMQEANGYILFKENCNACHAEPMFTNHGFANNGLSVDTTLNDFGKWMVSRNSEDSLMFKIPSLRNLGFTPPYMHDGRFGKLREVLNHYSAGILVSPTLAQELNSPMVLTSNEKTDLIAFLLTLNDKEFVFNEKHQFPKEILQWVKELKN